MSERSAQSLWGVIVATCFVLFAATVAHGQEKDAPPFDLDWRAPAGCPSPDRVRSEITRLIGADAHPEGVNHVTGEITAQEGGSYLVRLSLEQAGRSGERTLVGATCAEVSRAAALLIALAIEPGAAQVEPEPAPSPPPPAPPPPAPPLPAPPPPPPAKSNPHLQIAIGPAAELGLLPTLGAGAEASLEVVFEHLSLEAYFADYLSRDHDAPSGNAGGTFSLRSLGARACFELAPGTLSFAACGGASTNHLSARGYGVSNPGSSSTNLGAVALSVRVALALGSHASLRLDAGPSYILGQAKFVLADDADTREVYGATLFDAAGSLKLAWRF